ncbi:LuxR C-terminal-related transcriptional regulator [Microbacterium aurum]
MTLTTGTTPAVTAAATPAAGVMRLIVDAALGALSTMPTPLRAVVTGPAGSGRSTALRALRDELSATGRTVTTLSASPTAVLPSGTTLLVDDAESLDDGTLARIEQLVTDPGTGIVIAYSAHPMPPRLARIIREVEHAAPPVLLGEITALQVAESTRVPALCADAIVRFTGALTWLTLAAVDAHDPGSCDNDPAHRELAASLRGQVMHRLDRVDADVRSAVEALCLFPPSHIAAMAPPAAGWEAAIRAGWAAGLLTRSGLAPAAVQTAVRHDLPVHRLAELLALDADVTAADPGRHRGPDVAAPLGERLLVHGDQVRETDPERAMALYGEALARGVDPQQCGLRFGVAAVAAGDLDAAAATFDRITATEGHPLRGDAAEASLAVWAARGALRAGVAALDREDEIATSAVSAARRALARTGAGLAPAPQPPRGGNDTLAIASTAVTAGVTASLGADLDGVVDDLTLASELYSASRCDFPLVEPPAVVAAAAALASGRVAVAADTIAAALESRQCGPWARPRLQLWQVWVTLMQSRPDEARDLLARVRAENTTLRPRDRLIAAACDTGLARRYGDVSALASAFRHAERVLLRQRFDLFQHPFLGELMLAGHRVDASADVDRHFAREIAALAALGDPPLWSVPLHWAGLQRGIIRNRPDLVVPHAHALLAAAAHHPFAERLAAAGRVWTDVLAASVDPARVEAAAHALAHDGLAWDGARLAAHGAARTPDRAAASQLLACARDLHPRGQSSVDAPTPASAPRVEPGALSEREVEVARLVMQGKTYVEIGQTLFISPRTAEHHIARIRRRLDATSRSDLIAKLRDELDPGRGRDGSS